MVPGSRAGVHRDHCRHNIPTFTPPKTPKTSLEGKGALTGAAHAAVERVRRAVGLGDIMVDVPNCRGQSVASRTRTCEEEKGEEEEGDVSDATLWLRLDGL